jgi:hypothetical protein
MLLNSNKKFNIWILCSALFMTGLKLWIKHYPQTQPGSTSEGTWILIVAECGWQMFLVYFKKCLVSLDVKSLNCRAIIIMKKQNLFSNVLIHDYAVLFITGTSWSTGFSRMMLCVMQLDNSGYTEGIFWRVDHCKEIVATQMPGSNILEEFS